MRTRIARPNSDRISLYWKAAALILVAVVLTIPASLAADSNHRPRVLPPGSHQYDMSYGEWSASWWQWAFSLPVDKNPLFDETGCANGAIGQHGPVWFLTGVINVSGAAERSCIVPHGRALFFPVLNVECSTIEGNGSTKEELRACTDFYMNLVTDVRAEIDGVPVRDVVRYRAASPPFYFGPLPENNVLQFFGVDAPAGATSLSVADGFYLMLPPLPVGNHTVKFGGTFGPPISFTVDITYHLTVK